MWLVYRITVINFQLYYSCLLYTSDIMLAKAAVLCGKNTIQVRELELPPIGDDELLVKNISNSICLSTYKAALLGEDHKRVPDNISERPPITGHEFTGIIMEVGNHLKDRFQPGEKFVLQPAICLLYTSFSHRLIAALKCNVKRAVSS